MTKKTESDSIVSNVSPEARAAIRKAKADLDARDAEITQMEHQRVHRLIVQKLDRLLHDHGGAACPNCNYLRRFVHEPVQFATGGPDEPHAVVPPLRPMPTMVPYSCQRCGNVRWAALNAVLQAPADGDPPRQVAGTGPTPVPDSSDSD